MRGIDAITDDIDALFAYCKHLLEKDPIQHEDFVNALFQLGDLRSELTQIVGQEKAYEITARSYKGTFSI